MIVRDGSLASDASPVGSVNRQIPFLLVSGRDVDWAQNLRAARGGEVVQMARRFKVRNPRIVDGEHAKAWLPAVVRPVLLTAGFPGYVLLDA